MLMRVLRRLQPFFVALALIFIGLLLHAQWGELQRSVWRIDLRWLALSAGFMLAAWAVEVLLWLRMLNTVGRRLPYRVALRIWFLSAIVRYIPGNIWQPMSLTYLAAQRGVQIEATLTTIILYQVITILAVGPIAAAYFPLTGNWGILTDVLSEAAFAAIALGLAPAIVFLVWPRWLLEGINWGLHRIGRPRLLIHLSRSTLLFLFALGAFDWLLWGAAFYALAFGIGVAGPTGSKLAMLHLLPLYPVAYAIGFLSFLTPSGLGVREGALYVLLAPLLGGGGATALALAMRIWTTLGEVIAAGVSALFPDRSQDAADRRSHVEKPMPARSESPSENELHRKPM
ncbi:MAG: flippase-like domain-containing protein [Caldilinea sp.]|nr:flippase-like domain-containing protein [Caldilinea sp.]MDW8439321.1 lysylphosphatidylglycerol synthase transmembrane domain-containing protein [Caldilineaceae bacterium]